jgi:hypothetical protein
VSSKAKAEAVVYGLDKLGDLLAGIQSAAPYVGLGALTAGALAPQEAEAGPIKILSHIDDAGRAVYKTVIDAWHGSPHKFPPTERNPLGEFDISKIGTGEGAQAYGHGLYLADAKDVGNQYRINLGYNPDEMKIAGTQINDYYTTLSDQAAALPVEQARPLYDRMELVERLMQNESVSDVAKYADELGQGEWFGKEVAPSYETFGGLYRAQIDVDPDTLLDWDKPLSEQSEAVQQRVKQAAINRGLPLDDAGNPLFLQGNPDGQAINATLSGMKGQEGGSSVLRDAGIPGIRYLDGVSRNAGEGSYNYVIFDDKPINIVERGNATPAALAATAAGTGAGMTATSSQQDGGNYFRDNFNTQLSPQEEQAYQGWLVKQGMQLGRDLRHEADDYDMRGLFKDTGGANIDPGHGTDRYKKPNHPTFSDESVYSGVSDVVKGGRFLGGQWGGDDQSGYTYTPSPNMLERTHTPERLSRYMGEREKNVQLVMPPPYRQQQEQLNSSPLQIDTTGQYSDQINAYVRDAFEAQTAADQFTQMRSSKQGYWEQRRQDLLDMVDSLGELAVESSPTLVGAMGMIGMNKDRLMTDADMPLRSLLAGGGAIMDAAQGQNLQTIGNNAQQIIQSPSEDTTYGVGGTITDALSPYIPDEAAAAAGALVHGGLQIGTL